MNTGGQVCWWCQKVYLDFICTFMELCIQFLTWLSLFGYFTALSSFAFQNRIHNLSLNLILSASFSNGLSNAMQQTSPKLSNNILLLSHTPIWVTGLIQSYIQQRNWANGMGQWSNLSVFMEVLSSSCPKKCLCHIICCLSHRSGCWSLCFSLHLHIYSIHVLFIYFWLPSISQICQLLTLHVHCSIRPTIIFFSGVQKSLFISSWIPYIFIDGIPLKCHTGLFLLTLSKALLLFQ